MNTENSITNESNRFRHYFTNKLSLKNPSKTIALAKLSIYYTWKMLSLNIAKINLKYMLQTWMIHLIYLLDFT